MKMKNCTNIFEVLIKILGMELFLGMAAGSTGFFLRPRLIGPVNLITCRSSDVGFSFSHRWIVVFLSADSLRLCSVKLR